MTQETTNEEIKVVQEIPDMPLMHGWWGEPWPSGVCYISDSEGERLFEEGRVPVPVGETCLQCDSEIQEGENGVMMPLITVGENGPTAVRAYIHKECNLRSVLGCMAHIEKKCSCYGGTEHSNTREDALAVWEWATTHLYGGWQH